MLLNVLMNEFILALWKRRGWWLLGGCAGVNACLVKPVEMAALTPVSPHSKCTMGRVCGNACTALPDCPGWMHKQLGRTGDRWPKKGEGWAACSDLRVGFQTSVWTYGSGWSCLHQEKTKILFLFAVCWGFPWFYDAATIIYLRHLCPACATPMSRLHMEA